MIAGLVALATALSFASPGQAAVAPEPAPHVVAVNGHSYDVAALTKAAQDAKILYTGGKFVTKPGASASLVRWAADANARKAAAGPKALLACKNPVQAKRDPNPNIQQAYLWMRDCMFTTVDGFLGFADAIAGVLIGAGVGGPIAAVIVAVIMTSATAMIAANAACDFRYDRHVGLYVSVRWWLWPPTAAPPIAHCWHN